MADTRRRRWRVLLMLVDGLTADGYYEHVGDELPDEGAIIDVRDTQAPDQVIRARVRHVDERNPLPIAAVQVFPG